MPKEIKYGDGSITLVYRKNELPRNVQILVREFEDANLQIRDVTYEIIKPSPEEEDQEVIDDLTIYLNVNAEFAAMNFEVGNRGGRYFENQYESMAKVLGIDNLYVFTEYTDKEKFADKFLKKLKNYIKTTDFAKHIHSVRFDLKDIRHLGLTIVKKKDSWSASDREIKDKVKEYLATLGFPNIHIYIP